MEGLEGPLDIISSSDCQGIILVFDATFLDTSASRFIRCFGGCICICRWSGVELEYMATSRRRLFDGALRSCITMTEVCLRLFRYKRS
jgi:hypothetical protein